MVLIDADVLVIDQRYSRDVRSPENSHFLAELRSRGVTVGITVQALLEVVGNLSHGTAKARIAQLPALLTSLYGLSVIPDYVDEPMYANCLFDEIVHQMTLKMSLGDAVQCVQINKFAGNASVFVTWNAKHFLGKLPIPVQTPAEWLATLAP